MIDINELIRHFGALGVPQLLIDHPADQLALDTVTFPDTPGRTEVMRTWLRNYQVFQGIGNPARTAISEAVLAWADNPDRSPDLDTVDTLCQAHESMEVAVNQAFGGNRTFTSLASKALWLCYPDRVPLFDSFAQRALWTLNKLEPNVMAPAQGAPQYRQFVQVWMSIFDRYGISINEINAANYPYPVRILDKVLWIVGCPGYNIVL